MEMEGENACTCSGIIWMIFFLIVTAGNVTWLVMMFLNFGTLEGCSTNLTLLVVTAVASFFMQFIVCFRLR